MPSIAIGCDIGGSHISNAAVNLVKGQIIPGTHFQNSVASRGDANKILQTWIKTICSTIDCSKQGELTGIGIAIPGPFDYANGIAMYKKVPKYENLYGINISEAIRKGLGLNYDLPVRFINDASSLAIAESWIGKTSIYRKSIAITLGTGFGSAFINNGIPTLEGKFIPELGCLWHLPFKEGIVDDYFSTRWFVNSHFRMTGIKLEGTRELAELADNGDPVAISIFEEFGQNLAEMLIPWIRSYNCEAVVAGGNISEAGNLWKPAMYSTLQNNQISIPVLLSELKEDAAILGSARMMDNTFWEKIQPLLSKM